MGSLLLRILAFTCLPVAAMILGGLLVVFRAPGPQLGSAIQHFAAGMVFAAVAIELLPEVVSKHAPVATILGFAVGIALMLVIRRVTEPAAPRRKAMAERPTGLITAVGVDIAIDGLLMGIGFVAGARQGLLHTIALTFELLSLGLATLVALAQAGTTRRRSFMTVVGLALLPLIGALVGGSVLARLSGPALNAVLAFGVAALLYLVTEELLVEAHEVPETPAITSMFFLSRRASYLRIFLAHQDTIFPVFSHPDYTVGSGTSPDPASLYKERLAGSTADQELRRQVRCLPSPCPQDIAIFNYDVSILAYVKEASK